MQVWLPASLSVIPNTAFLQRVSTPLADVTAWYSPRFRAGRDEMSACVKSITCTAPIDLAVKIPYPHARHGRVPS